MLVQFDFRKIEELENGAILEALNQSLQRAIFDCDDRPAVEKARKVKLEISVVPICGPKGDLHSVDVTFRVDDKIPVRSSTTINMGHRLVTDQGAKKHQLVFNSMSTNDAHAKTLFDHVVDANERSQQQRKKATPQQPPAAAVSHPQQETDDFGTDEDYTEEYDDDKDEEEEGWSG